MSVLITRPAPQGQALVAQLQEHGVIAYAYPMLEIIASPAIDQLPHELQQLQAGDSLCAISRHATHFAAQYLQQQQIDWPTTINYFAVGKQSAQQLQQACLQTVAYCAAQQTSEGLLTLTGLKQIAGKRVLILRGQAGREHLAQSLMARGAQVSYCQCYQRQVIHYDSLTTVAQWQQQQIRLIVVTSAEILYQLYTLCKTANATAWLLQCRLLTVSQRLTNIAKQQGWQYITTADNPNNRSLLTAVLTLISADENN